MFQVADCGLKVAGCRLQVAGCKLRVVSCKFQVSRFGFQILDFRFQILSLKFQVARFRVAGLQGCRVARLQGCRVAGLQGCRVAGCRFQVSECRLQVAGCRLLVAGCRLLVAGCWLQVAGCRLQVAGCRSFFHTRKMKEVSHSVRLKTVACERRLYSRQTVVANAASTHVKPSWRQSFTTSLVPGTSPSAPPPCFNSNKEAANARAAAQPNRAPHRMHHACSALLRKMWGSDLALALAKLEKKLLVFSDDLPPTSPARTTSRALRRGCTSSG